MNQILTILLTLIFSQYLYREYGSDHFLARSAQACVELVRSLLHTVMNVME